MTTVVHSASALGQVVRDARVRGGYSQADVAERARVGRQWLVGLEAGGKASAPLDMVFRVLEALDLTITLAPLAKPEHAAFIPPSADEVLSQFIGAR